MPVEALPAPHAVGGPGGCCGPHGTAPCFPGLLHALPSTNLGATIPPGRARVPWQPAWPESGPAARRRSRERSATEGAAGSAEPAALTNSSIAGVSCAFQPLAVWSHRSCPLSRICKITEGSAVSIPAKKCPRGSVAIPAWCRWSFRFLSQISGPSLPVHGLLSSAFPPLGYRPAARNGTTSGMGPHRD